jgi:hypothetical protein
MNNFNSIEKNMKNFSVRYTDFSKKLFIENIQSDSIESITKNFSDQKEKYLLEIICLEKKKYVFDAKSSDLTDCRAKLEALIADVEHKIKERKEAGSVLFDEDIRYLLEMNKKFSGALFQSY